MMDNSMFVSSFTLDNRDKLYARVIWIENVTDLFHIEIYDKQDLWTGRFSNEFAERFRERNEQETDEYRKNVKASLMNQNNSNYEFVRAIGGDSATAQFSWKNTYKVDGEPVTIIHGSVPVHKKLLPENTNPIIDFLLDENQSLRKLVEEYETNINQLSGELDQSKSELEKFLNIKSSLEMSMYEKFISLLNSKKRRIQVLEQNLNELESFDITKQSEVD